MTVAPCVTCSERPRHVSRNGKVTSWCRPCTNARARVYSKQYRAANKERRAIYARRNRLKTYYGLTIDQFDAMWARQGGRCLVCDVEMRKDFGGRGGHYAAPTIDHDHGCCPGERSCGKCIRGLLCVRCNGGIGAFKDNPAILRRAVAYLAAYGEK